MPRQIAEGANIGKIGLIQQFTHRNALIKAVFEVNAAVRIQKLWCLRNDRTVMLQPIFFITQGATRLKAQIALRRCASFTAIYGGFETIKSKRSPAVKAESQSLCRKRSVGACASALV